jgi:ABC-2 type transport system permease protein
VLVAANRTQWKRPRGAGAAANALTQVAQANQEFLPPWQGGLVLAAYGLILAAAGTLATTRRDIT